MGRFAQPRTTINRDEDGPASGPTVRLACEGEISSYSLLPLPIATTRSAFVIVPVSTTFAGISATSFAATI
jgi:hypothetical protein